MSKNEFDILQRPMIFKTEKITLSKNYTKEEIEDYLRNYIEIPKLFWNNLKYDTHVRYFKTTGEFVIGGFVYKVKKNKNLEIKNGIKTTYSNFVKWTVNFKEIEKLYAKPDAITLTLYYNLIKINQQINTK